MTTSNGSLPATPAPIVVDHPKILDTARFVAGDRVLTLRGLAGLGGAPADGLQAYIIGNGDQLTCQSQPNGEFVCDLPDGIDIADAALLNGAARTRPDAPERYKQQEQQAISARRGLWASLPPPPVVLGSPVVLDTATLAAGTERYVLAGVQGYVAPYAGQLQAYVGAKGNSLTCQGQGDGGRYVCLLPDGADIASVALLNGAARVAPDAPDSYRHQQADAMTNRRGIWHDVTPGVVAAFLEAPPLDPAYVLVPEDQGDGIVYVGGLPAAVIAGESVFLTFAGDAGWGYYDHAHGWHAAPERYRAHMERFHPEGRNLHGMHDAAFRRDADRARRQDAAGVQFARVGHGIAHFEPAHLEAPGARNLPAGAFPRTGHPGEARSGALAGGYRPPPPSSGFHPPPGGYGGRAGTAVANVPHAGGMPAGASRGNFVPMGFRSPEGQPSFGQVGSHPAAGMQGGFHRELPGTHATMASMPRPQGAPKPCQPKHC